MLRRIRARNTSCPGDRFPSPKWPRASVFLSTVVLVLLAGAPACAQHDPGGLTGTVLDRITSRELPGVYVKVLGTAFQVIGDARGAYSIGEIPPGIYSVGFVLPGYRPLIRPDVSIVPGRATELSVVLEPEADTDGDKKLYHLEEYTVWGDASYFETNPEVEVSGRSVSSQEIVSQSGALNDIQRVVQVMPSVTSGADQENEIIVRGGNYGENLFLLDGMEIPNPNHFAYQGAGGGPISILSAELIRDVDFIAGAFPARYGDKASSVLDISLRKGSRDSHLMMLDTSMGGARALLEGPLGSAGTYILTANRSFVDLIASGWELTAIPKFGSVHGKLSYDLGRHRILWNTLVSDDRIEIEPDDEKGEDDFVDFHSGLLASGVTVKSVLGEHLTSDLIVSHVRNYWDYDVWDERSAVTLDQFNNESVESETSARGEVQWMIGEHSLSGGVQVKNCRFDHDIFATDDTTYVYDTGFPSTAQDTILAILDTHPAWRVRNDVDTWKKSAYAQVRVTPFARLALRLGGRYDRIDYTDESYVSPRLAARYALARNLWLSAAYGVHYQSPQYLILSAHPRNRETVDSYHTRQFVVGTEWLPRPDTRVTVEAYAKQYRDVPVAKEWITPDPWDDFDAQGEMVNAARGHSEGIEFYLQRKMSTSFYYILSYSWYRARFTDPRNGRERPWDFDHRNVCTLSAGKRWRMSGVGWYEDVREKLWYRLVAVLLPFGDEVLLSARWRYAGGRPYTQPVYLREFHEWITPADADFNTERYPAYHRLDVRLDRTYFHKNWSMTLYFDFVNVYGRENIWAYTYDEDGSTDTIHQFSTIPFVGLSVKF